ncbi:MAG: DUF3137 domain-containing protein [Saprospiraceae bacterium]
MKENKIKILHKVRPKLADLERQRKEMLTIQKKKEANIFLLAIVSLALVLVCGGLLGGIQVVLFGAVVVIVGAYHYLEQLKIPLRQNLQQSIGDIITEAIGSQWTYNADQHIPAYHFEKLGLTSKFNSIHGENLIHGLHGDTSFSFSYLDLSNDSKDNSNTVFKGILVVADFHKALKGKTLIFPDKAQRTLGSWLGKKVQEFGWKGLGLVYLEDPVFEEAFAVYASDQVEARYILTPSMMNNLLTLHKKYGENLSFFFTDGKVCIAIKNIESFEQDLSFPIFPDGTFHHFFQPIEIVTEIIDILNLNTRIWAKS